MYTCHCTLTQSLDVIWFGDGIRVTCKDPSCTAYRLNSGPTKQIIVVTRAHSKQQLLHLNNAPQSADITGASAKPLPIQVDSLWIWLRLQRTCAVCSVLPSVSGAAVQGLEFQHGRGCGQSSPHKLGMVSNRGQPRLTRSEPFMCAPAGSMPL